ncbi:thioredoxin-like [Protopterus annectens]|uniref:thioredoxin-like n=1 Tax=Protopterus annectens TaxID=7888 RepID=UPI001CF95FCD|nr:thioredoxin-like [Protopterus annectens]
MKVQVIKNQSQFDQALKDAGSQLVVVDFSAEWCGPCKGIKPFYHELSEKYSEVVFLEVDVNDAEDVSVSCGISCMPTFYFYKDGVKVHEFSGANKEKLEDKIQTLK